jgi:hypothetical protein
MWYRSPLDIINVTNYYPIVNWIREASHRNIECGSWFGISETLIKIDGMGLCYYLDKVVTSSS